jgi:hypothetical protein
VCQTGRGHRLDGDGGFVHLDSLEALGVIVELIEVPARLRTPDREWTPSR